MSNPLRTALVLAGAVAKGAFQAGVIQVLHERGWRFSRVVAASSGAINGAFWAAAVRAGREDSAAQALPELWRDRAGLGIFDLTLRGFLGQRGLSTGDRIVELLEDAVGGWLPGARQRAQLRLVVAPLKGVAGNIGAATATTYQKVLSFDDEAFDAQGSRLQAFRAATASGAFPGAFVPVELPELGACVDGGTVNNTPIKEALLGGADDEGIIDRIVVVSPNPLVSEGEPTPPHGLALVTRIADILINERLYRDLREAASVNQALAALDRLRADGTLDDSQLAKVKAAVDLVGTRQLEIVQVRPRQELRGNAFAGFGSQSLREEYLEQGRVAARALGPG
jgi:NTE family protein